MTRRQATFTVVLLLGALLTSACETMKSRDRSYNFDLQIIAYEKAVRWNEWEVAEGYRRPDGNFIPTDFSQYEGIKVSSINTLSSVPSADGNLITMKSKISYFLERSQSLRETTHVHQWEYDTELKRWFLITPLPRFD